MSDFEFIPKFSDEPSDENPVGSLSHYIQKHLQSRKVKNQEVFPANPNNISSFGPKSHLPNGMVLDDIDTELASSHLAQYLPTAHIRVSLKKVWIDKALEAVEKALSAHENDPSQEAQVEQKALRVRKKILQEKREALESEGATLNPFQAAYHTISHWLTSQPLSKTIPQTGWLFFHNPNHSLKQEAQALQSKLIKLENRLESQIHDPNLTPEDLTRMVNEFDRLAAQAEKQVAALKQELGLRHKISQWLNQQK